MPTATLDDIDLHAERQARAEQWMIENLDVPAAVPSIRREREMRDMARALGIEPPRLPRFQHRKAVARWCAIVDAFRAGRIPDSFRARYIETAADRARQEDRRRRKAELAEAILNRPDADRRATLAEACRLADCGLRTLERARSVGWIRSRRDGARVTVSLRDVAEYLRAAHLRRPRAVAC